MGLNKIQTATGVCLMLGRKSGSGLSRSGRIRAPVGWANESPLDRSAAGRAPFASRFGAMFAAAIGVAGAAFGSPPAAFSQAPVAPTPNQIASPAALTQAAGAPTPAQVTTLAAPTPPAGAAPAPTPLSNADKLIAADLLFKRLLLKPDDLDAGFQYAQLETELGDYEAAIGALERMLYYNPNLPRVKLQLGVLYFHLRSYEMARNYFDAVLNAPDTPADVRTEVQNYIAAVDKAVAINQFSIYGQFGLAYQTNANAGPNSPNVLALGQNALLSPEFQKTPDWNAFGLVTVHDFYDFNDQRGDGWESDLIAYYSQQFKVTRLDLGLAELRTGPRIGIGDYGGLTVHPYAIGNVLTLGGANYLNTAGAGVSLNWPVNENLTITPGVEFRDRWFSNSANYPTAEGQTRRAVDRLCLRFGADFRPVGPVVAGPRLLHRIRTQAMGRTLFTISRSISGCPIRSRRRRSRIRGRSGRSRPRSAFPTPLTRYRT